MKSMSPADRERWAEKDAQFSADSSAIEGIPVDVEQLKEIYKKVDSE